MGGLVSLLREKNIRKRSLGIFGSFGWSGGGMKEFEDFAGYCCRSPACGPYLRDACHDLSFEVHDRELSKEAILKELRIEMEKTRRLNELYEQRKELKIEIEPPEASAP